MALSELYIGTACPKKAPLVQPRVVNGLEADWVNIYSELAQDRLARAALIADSTGDAGSTRPG